MTRVNRHRWRLAACVLAATTAVEGCSSTSSNSATAPGEPASASTSAPDTSIPPTSVAPTPSGTSMSPPHVACQPSNVAQTYDGTMPHPTELCLIPGAVARLTINPPTGASWPKPTVQPSEIVSLDSSTVDGGGTLHVAVTAHSHGTATLRIPGAWQLQIAVA